MKVALTGATGLVGHPVLRHLLDAGHEVTAFGRRPPDFGARHRPWDLGADADLGGMDALVHAAFSHVPGRYRGGEGDDPDGFRRTNLIGTVALFEAARKAGVGRVVFLSSRAVYGTHRRGTLLEETMTPEPDTLYGEVKLEAERALTAMSARDFTVAAVRATGVYGPPVPNVPHKWAQLFQDHDEGVPISPRAGTEVHADDLARAILRLLGAPSEALEPVVFNASDFTLDRRELLDLYASLKGIPARLPDAADRAAVCAPSTQRLRRLGWSPMGPGALPATLRALLSV